MNYRRRFVAFLFWALSGSVLAQGVTAATPAPSPEELRQRLDAWLQSEASAGRFSGVVALARNGKTVYIQAHGRADREAGRDNLGDTAFNLGSINKQFTWIAIQQLAAQGKLDLDAPLAQAWPDYPDRDFAAKATVRQLLQHRSGIGSNIFALPASGKRGDLRHNRDYLPLVFGQPAAFAPGAQQRYSNAGYVVLGELVARLSGMDYYDYVQKKVFEPAGMVRTGSWTSDALPENTAIGYTRGGPDAPADAPWRRNDETLPGRGSAAGGGYSTAEDLLRFVQALRERKIANGPPPGIGIAGGAPGLNAAVDGDLPGGYDLVVLANLDPPAAERVAREVRGWLGVADD